MKPAFTHRRFISWKSAGVLAFGLTMLTFLCASRHFATAQEDLIDKFEVTQPKASEHREQSESRHAAPASAEFLPRPLPNEQRVLNALSESTEVAFVDTPLNDALNYLQSLHHIEIWIDKKALSDEGINTDQQVSLEISGVTLRSALKLLLDPLTLTFLIEDEVLKITTQAKANEAVITRSYPVWDLFTTREEAIELLEVLSTGLGLNPEGKPLVVSVSTRTLVARLNRPQQDQLLQLVLNLREANNALHDRPTSATRPATLKPPSIFEGDVNIKGHP